MGINQPAAIAREEKGDITGVRLLYYEVFEEEFDEIAKAWSRFGQDPSFPTAVEAPAAAQRDGYDVVSVAMERPRMFTALLQRPRRGAAGQPALGSPPTGAIPPARNPADTAPQSREDDRNHRRTAARRRPRREELR